MKQKELNQLANIVESLVPVGYDFILITYKDNKDNEKATLTYSSNLEDDKSKYILNAVIKKIIEEEI